jgi:hypothetical protein
MKKLSFLFGLFVIFGLYIITQAQDFVPGQIMIDIKHEYLPISHSSNAGGTILIELPSI